MGRHPIFCGGAFGHAIGTVVEDTFSHFSGRNALEEIREQLPVSVCLQTVAKR